MSACATTDAYDLSAFPRFEVTVDVVVLTVDHRQLSVLLVQRANQTEQHKWALPGGFKRPDETLDQAAARELEEETGLGAPVHLEQFRAYGDPGRDPRGNVVTIAYLAAVPVIGNVTGGGDARRAAVFPVADVVARKRSIAFDHRRIILDATNHVSAQLEQSDIALGFLPPTFTMSELRNIHEAVTRQRLEPANFRRRILALAPALIEPTGTRAPTTAVGGRPAELFRRTPRTNTVRPSSSRLM